MFENRTYRRFHQKQNLISFDITVKETNLHIQASKDLKHEALRSVLKHRGYIEAFAALNPGFFHTLHPFPLPPGAPAIVRDMISSAQTAGVGPMAAVAGAVAQYTGCDLLMFSDEVVIENGGDIFIKSTTDITVTVFAGDSALSMKTGIRIRQRPHPFAMCTSSGTIGHSKSFGKADAVTIISPSGSLADAVATALCNRIQKPLDIETAIAEGKAISGVEGIVIIKGSHIGLWGDVELVPLDRGMK